MSKTTRYGIIGCGMMGQEHLRNIALLEGTEIAAIFEPDPQMAQRALSLAPNARLVSSIADVLADPSVDCLLIASPNFRHVEQLEEIARTRPLPVLVEKPLFSSSGDLARLDTIMRDYPAPLWVAMEYRYMPAVSAFIQQLDPVTGGVKMLTIREHRFPFLDKVGAWNRFNRYSGSTLVEKCCHFFDLMRLIIGCEPVRVMASAGQDVNHRDERYDAHAPDIDDNAYVIVDFSNGVRAMLELCMFAEGSRYQEEICAIGPKGKIEALVPGPGRFWPEHLGEPPIAQVISSPRTPKGPTTMEIPVDPALLEAGDHNGSTFFQHQRFLELVRGERQSPEVTFHDGRMAVLMGLAASLSAQQHRAVPMSEFGA